MLLEAQRPLYPGRYFGRLEVPNSVPCCKMICRIIHTMMGAVEDKKIDASVRRRVGVSICLTAIVSPTSS